MAKRITIGNIQVSGFVNFVQEGRIVLGTGSYVAQGTRVFKENVTVFFDQDFNGTVPAKGKYVEVRADLVVQPRKDKADELNVTMNIKFANQIAEREAPTKRDAPASSDAGGADPKDI